jgi:hypothetical protein
MKARLFPLALLLLLAALLPSCGGNGGECDRCSSDDDCNSGLVCSTFDNGDQRCGSGTGATQCRVR